MPAPSREGVLTFEPHPREYFAPDAPPFRLMGRESRAHRLEKIGVKRLYELAFNSTLASLSPEAFARDVLHDGLGLAHVVVGADFCFGKGRAGTAEDLVRFGADHAQLQLAIVDEKALPLGQDAEEFGVGQAHAFIVARRRITVEREVGAVLDEGLAALEGADAQLGPLQIAQDRDRAHQVLFDRAHVGDGLAVGVMVAMAHVDAEGVGPPLDQLGDGLLVAAGRAQRGQNLDLALALDATVMRRTAVGNACQVLSASFETRRPYGKGWLLNQDRTAGIWTRKQR